MRRVKDFRGLPVRSHSWLKLADVFIFQVAFSACRLPARWTGYRTDRSAGQLLPVQAIVGSFGGAADAPHGGADQKREAAGDRVYSQGNPDWHGQSDAYTHGHEPDSSGQDEEPDKHFVQLPREECNQDARREWQEYGRVLVKVRRIIETFQKLEPAIPSEKRMISTYGSISGGLQPRADSALRTARSANKPLKGRAFRRLQPVYGVREVRSRTTGLAGDRCTAAMWRNFVIAIAAAIPELDEDCLSFVIPRKQGVAAAGHGDFN
jgi:hypothetical protein